MEREQSDFLTGRKVNGKLAAWLGAVFSIGLMAVTTYAYVGLEFSLVLIIFTASKSVLFFY